MIRIKDIDFPAQKIRFGIRATRINDIGIFRPHYYMWCDVCYEDFSTGLLGEAACTADELVVSALVNGWGVYHRCTLCDKHNTRYRYLIHSFFFSPSGPIEMAVAVYDEIVRRLRKRKIDE